MSKFSKESLWDLYQFVTINHKAIKDVTPSLDYILEKDHNLIFIVDFSDIHPIMYPSRKKDYYDREMPLHGDSVRMLWRNLIRLSEFSKDFKLTLSPGARMEVFESLRHCKCRIDRELNKYIPHEILDGSYEEIINLLESPKFEAKNFVKSFEGIVDNHGIDEGVKKPAKIIIDLFKKNILFTLEEVIPSSMKKCLLTKDNANANEILTDYFNANPRKKTRDIEQIAHDKFHDKVDKYNILLTQCLNQISKEKYNNYCTPFITHTHRVLAAGRKLNKASYPSMVQSSLTPLYIATGIKKKGKAKLKYFFNFAFNIISELKTELESTETICILKKMDKKSREDIFNEREFVRTNDRIYRLTEIFYKDVFEDIDQVNDQPSRDKQNDNKEIEIGNLKELVNKIKDAQVAAKEVSAQVKNIIGGEFISGLAGRFTPKDEYSKDLTDWLDS